MRRSEVAGSIVGVVEVPQLSGKDLVPTPGAFRESRGDEGSNALPATLVVDPVAAGGGGRLALHDKPSARSTSRGGSTNPGSRSTSSSIWRPCCSSRTYEEMEACSSRSTNTQTMTITNRLNAILSSIPRQGPTVRMVAL